MPTRREPLAPPPDRGAPAGTGADAARPRDALLRDVVDALRRGQLCALPTETVYGLAALPGHERAEAAARRLTGRAPDQPFALHLADPADVAGAGARVTLAAERLIERYWPGPLTLILPAAAGGDAAPIGVRVPAHDFTRDVIRAVGGPLWLAGIVDDDGAPLGDPDAVAARCDDDVALLVDDGQATIGAPSTVVRATGGELEVLREGILSRDEVLSAAADLILFVCTGNTCRSPMAEAMAREATAQAMGVPAERLLARGLRFASAGTATVPDMPASEGSLAAAGELGLDLGAHLSQPVSPELWQRASHIYCLSESHRRALLAEAPEVADRVALLRPDGLDIADPFGGDLEVYRRARDEIRAAVEARRADWWP